MPANTPCPIAHVQTRRRLEALGHLVGDTPMIAVAWRSAAARARSTPKPST
jgi:hypothetical protein